MAVAVEIARAAGLPVRPRIKAQSLLVDRGGPIHFPDRDLTVRVLEQDVCRTVGVEIASVESVPGWTGVGVQSAAADIQSSNDAWASVHVPERDLAIAILP